MSCCSGLKWGQRSFSALSMGLLNYTILECASRQKYVENDIGWSRTLELSGSCVLKSYISNKRIDRIVCWVTHNNTILTPIVSVHCGHDCRYGTDEAERFTVKNALDSLRPIIHCKVDLLLSITLSRSFWFANATKWNRLSIYPRNR